MRVKNKIWPFLQVFLPFLPFLLTLLYVFGLTTYFSIFPPNPDGVFGPTWSSLFHRVHPGTTEYFFYTEIVFVMIGIFYSVRSLIRLDDTQRMIATMALLASIPVQLLMLMLLQFSIWGK